MIELHPNVLAALRHPLRGMEVRGWLKTHQKQAFAWRGEHGETMMHWAFLSDWVLACELRDAGLSFDTTDNRGRNPFDWLTDRLYSTLLSPRTKGMLSKGGEERLIKQTEEQGMQLWMMGARPTSGQPFFGAVWLQSGAFELAQVALQEKGPAHWMPNGATALHALVLAPPTPKRTRWFNELLSKMDINDVDDDGRSALWYALDAWLKHPQLHASLFLTLEELLSKGAHLDDKDNFGYSPRDVLQFDPSVISPKLQNLLINNC